MDEDELREYEEDARKHGIPYMLDRMGLDGIGNDVNDLHKRILELEEQVDELEGIMSGRLPAVTVSYLPGTKSMNVTISNGGGGGGAFCDQSGGRGGTDSREHREDSDA